MLVSWEFEDFLYGINVHTNATDTRMYMLSDKASFKFEACFTIRSYFKIMQTPCCWVERPLGVN